MSISAFFNRSSIEDQFLLIVCNPGEECRPGLDGPTGLDWQLDGWENQESEVIYLDD